MVIRHLPPRSLGMNLGLIWDYYTSLGRRSYYQFVYLWIIAYAIRHRDTYIRGLSATFGTYQSHEELTSVVKYEEQVDSDPNIQTPMPLSKFSLLVDTSYRSHTMLTNI